MKVEILATGKIENVFKDENVSYTKKYTGEKYKVIELEKTDAKRFSNAILDGAWCRLSNGVGGSICDFVTVNHGNLIGWSTGNNDYKTLTDYLSELGSSDAEICDYAVGLARANGLSLSKLFGLYEG